MCEKKSTCLESDFQKGNFGYHGHIEHGSHFKAYVFMTHTISMLQHLDGESANWHWHHNLWRMCSWQMRLCSWQMRSSSWQRKSSTCFCTFFQRSALHAHVSATGLRGPVFQKQAGLVCGGGFWSPEMEVSAQASSETCWFVIHMYIHEVVCRYIWIGCSCGCTWDCFAFEAC